MDIIYITQETNQENRGRLKFAAETPQPLLIRFYHFNKQEYKKKFNLKSEKWTTTTLNGSIQKRILCHQDKNALITFSRVLYVFLTFKESRESRKAGKPIT